MQEDHVKNSHKSRCTVYVSCKLLSAVKRSDDIMRERNEHGKVTEGSRGPYQFKFSNCYVDDEPLLLDFSLTFRNILGNAQELSTSHLYAKGLSTFPT